MQKKKKAARAAQKTRKLDDYYVVRLEPRSRLRFAHPKGRVTIIANDGPGFVKVNDAVVFHDEFVRMHDSSRVSTITSYEMPVLLEISSGPRTDATPPPRRLVSLIDVEVWPTT
jgi:hypothetical protein